MFVLGHLGIGPRLLGAYRRRFPALWLLLGCILPDLIDKPLFYLLLWSEGHPDAVITGSRSIGHSFLFLLALWLLGLRWPRFRAVALGVATHFLLDLCGEVFGSADPDQSIWLAFLYPLYGHFPVAQFHSLGEHLLLSARNAYTLFGEFLGAVLIYFDHRRTKVSR